MPEHPPTPAPLDAAYHAAFGALDALADAHLAAGQLADAARALGVGAQLAEATAVPPREAAIRWLRQGNLLALRGFLTNEGFAEAIAALERAHELAEGASDPTSRAAALAGLGMALHYRRLGTGEGTIDEALALFEQALALRETAGDARGRCESIFQVGLMAQFKGDWDAAQRAFAASYDLARRHDWKLEQSYAVRHLGFWQLRAGQPEEALASMRESLALREAIGQRLLYPFSEIAIGDAYAALGELGCAADHHRVALDLAGALGLGVPRAFAILSLGEVAEASGDRAGALGRYREALAEGERLRLARLQRACQDRIAALADDAPA